MADQVAETAEPPADAAPVTDDAATEVAEVSVAPSEAPEAAPDVVAEPTTSAGEAASDAPPPDVAAAAIEPVAEAVAPDEQKEREAATAAAEPEMIEVWRPGRSEGRRRPQGRHRHAGKYDAPRVEPGIAAPAVAADGQSIAPAEPAAATEQTAHADQARSAEADSLVGVSVIAGGAATISVSTAARRP